MITNLRFLTNKALDMAGLVSSDPQLDRQVRQSCTEGIVFDIAVGLHRQNRVVSCRIAPP